MHTPFGSSLAKLLEPISSWYSRTPLASSLHCLDCPYSTVCTELTTGGLLTTERHEHTNAYTHSDSQFSLVSMETASLGHIWCTWLRPTKPANLFGSSLGTTR